jgi:hypothetical protein
MTRSANLSDLAEFLRSRVDEDESLARAAMRSDDIDLWSRADVHGVPDLDVSRETLAYIRRLNPERILAECAAVRGIVDSYQNALAVLGSVTPTDEFALARARAALDSFAIDARLLALRYADHPDYLAGWKPARARLRRIG